jgi:hypothetical protein
MTDQPATARLRPPPARYRRPALLLVALVAVVLGLPLALDVLAGVTDQGRRPWALSASTGWALVVLGGVVGLLAGLVLGSRWPRLAALAATGAAAGAMLFAFVLVLPGLALGVPGCGAPAQPASGTWHLEAASDVDGMQRDHLALGIQPISRTGQPLLGRLLIDVRAVAIEDLGVDLLDVDSLYARHCRALVSGSQVTAALPLLANGAGVGEPLVPAQLPVWRGDFDWWVSGDGELVGARFRVGGHPIDAWPSQGNRGLLTVELWPVAGGAQP